MNKNKKFRTAIYCRVSSDKEEQRNSLGVQESLYRYYVRHASDLELVTVIKETKSGLDTDRDGIKRLLEMAETHEIDLILIKSISRLSRNAEEIIKLCKRFLELKVDVYFELENIHLNDMHEKVTENFSLDEIIKTYAFAAQDYSQTASRHIRWGIKRSFESEKSGYQNRICYGYKKADGKIVINEEEAKTVKEIFALSASGASLGQIIKTMEAKNILSPSGKPKWSKPVLKHLLTNEKYIGYTVLGKTRTVDYLSGARKTNNGESVLYIHEDTHPPIVEKELFEQVQKKFDD